MNECQPTIVKPGLLVRIEISYEAESEQLEFVIVPDEQADFAAGFLGQGTALAKAILDEPVGSLVPYFAGDARSVRILSAEPTDKTPNEDAAARRQATLDKAVRQSDHTSAMMFASSFSGKWGDYDPQGIEEWNKTNGEQPPGDDQGLADSLAQQKT
jgi:hypothetical protein